MNLKLSTPTEYEAEIARLLGVIADAIAALDEGRRGDVRRILRTGRSELLKAVTGVIAGDGAA